MLLDEVGGGTDPVEGAALTMAVLDGLRARGAKTVVTTHLHLLKAYGALYPDVLNVSVEFDPGTLRPTYRMIYGRPGESHALLMAEKAGLPPELVRKAHGYLGEGERKVSELLQSARADAARGGRQAPGNGEAQAGGRRSPQGKRGSHRPDPGTGNADDL